MYYVLKLLGDTLGSCSSQSYKLTIYMHLRFVHSGSVDQNMTWDITVKNKPLKHFPYNPWYQKCSFLVYGGMLRCRQQDFSPGLLLRLGRPKEETADEKFLDHTVTFPAFEDLN